MGLYIDASKIPARLVRGHDLPILAWLHTIGTEVPADSSPFAGKTLVFWQQSPWGENAAIGYDRPEVNRLRQSGVFSHIYSVDTSLLKQYAKF